MQAKPLPKLPGFEILRCVARGGMGEVYLARVLEGGLRDTDVIVKRLYPRFARDPAHVDLFVAEARLGERIVHSNIAQTYELIRRSDDLFIVQEYIEGCTLRELMHADSISVSLAARTAVFSDMLAALVYLQEGVIRSPVVRAVIHRDISPDNVVVRLDGLAKLVDLGVAEVEGQPDRKRSGALRGTPAYMSPEQARGRVLDRRSDLFSAGIVLWELLAGKQLFVQPNEFETIRMINDEDAPLISSVNPQAARFDAMLVRALQRDREDRFDSASDMLVAFRAACVLAKIQPNPDALATAVQRLATTRTSDPRSLVSATPEVA